MFRVTYVMNDGGPDEVEIFDAEEFRRHLLSVPDTLNFAVVRNVTIEAL